MTILGVCGSLQARSANRALLETAGALMPADCRLELFEGLRDLPHFNQDLEDQGTPDSVRRWRLALARCDAVFVASPEYGFSLPGVVKNGIDWVIGSGELERKIVAVTSAVAAPGRGRRGLEALGATLSAVRATIVGGEPIHRGPDFEMRVAALVRSLVDTVRSSAGA